MAIINIYHDLDIVLMHYLTYIIYPLTSYHFIGKKAESLSSFASYSRWHSYKMEEPRVELVLPIEQPLNPQVTLHTKMKVFIIMKLKDLLRSDTPKFSDSNSHALINILYFIRKLTFYFQINSSIRKWKTFFSKESFAKCFAFDN